VVAPPDRDHENHHPMIDHFIDQAVAGVSQLDLVGVFELPAQLCLGNMGCLQALGQLFLE
jgi:hypothetical protein